MNFDTKPLPDTTLRQSGDATGMQVRVAGKNPPIRVVSLEIYEPALWAGFRRSTNPTSPIAYADRDDFFDFHFRRRYREGSRLREAE